MSYDPNEPGATEPTQPMPAAGAAAGATPPPPPPGDDVAVTGEEDVPPPVPWYKRPAAIAAIIAAVVALIVIAVIQFTGDDPPSHSATLVIDRRDVDRVPIDREITATVIGPDDARGEFDWLSPADAVAPEPATTTSSGDGLARWVWAPNDAVDEPEEWRSTVTLTEVLPVGFAPDSPEYTCSLERRDQATSVVTLAVDVALDGELETLVALYEFPGFEFSPGDILRCEVQDRIVDVTTTTPTTTTTVPETTTTTTTAPETTTTTTAATTTVPDATTTTAPATTVPDTTVPATTTTAPADTTTTTAPAGQNAMAIIDSRADLSTLRGLIDSVPGFRDVLANPPEPYTIFAPNNDAFAALGGSENPPDLSDPATVTNLLLGHLSEGEALSIDEVLGRGQIQVAFGDPQPVDAGASPPTIGGAGLIESPPNDANTALHLLNAVLTPVTG